jgi:hypothetical protein
MVVINVLNLGVAALIYKRSLEPKDGSDSAYRTRMRIMGLIFTLVGAYRAVFVSRYFTQMAWFDTVLNSSLLIRTFAMAAELSFAGLFALAMLQVNADFPAIDDKRSGGFKTFLKTQTPYFLIACIFLAQFFAYGGLIMKSKTLFAIEESLWSLGFVSILPLAFMQWQRLKAVGDESLKMLKGSTRLILAWCVIYCCYGLFYHLPLENWPSAFQQLETGIPAIKTGWTAIRDSLLIVHESKAYSDWGFGFLLWHSAYFSICVWIALYLMRAPRLTIQPK